MKRMFTLFLAVMMVMTMFAGCGAHDETAYEPDINAQEQVNNAQEQVNQNQDKPMNPNQNTQTQYIKDGKFNYSDIMFFNCKGTNGEGTVEFLPNGPAVNELCAELKALYPDVAKGTIMNIVSPMVNVENVHWAAEQERGIQNGDVVTLEVSVIQSKIDMWNEHMGDIELIIEPTYTITVEGLEEAANP